MVDIFVVEGLAVVVVVVVGTFLASNIGRHLEGIHFLIPFTLIIVSLELMLALVVDVVGATVVVVVVAVVVDPDVVGLLVGAIVVVVAVLGGGATGLNRKRGRVMMMSL